MRREKRAVENFDPSKKTVEAGAALHPFPPPHPPSAPNSIPSQQGGFLSPAVLSLLQPVQLCQPGRGTVGFAASGSSEHPRDVRGDVPRVTLGGWQLPRGCERCQLPSLAGAHRLDTGGSAAEKTQRDVEEAEKGDCKIPLKTGIILAPRAAA